jgi:hypothetical protein
VSTFKVFRNLASIFAISFVTSHTFAAGWQPEQSVTTTSVTSKSTCANLETRNEIHCVFQDKRTGDSWMRLYETTSTNGGVTWSSPTHVTTNADATNNQYQDNDYDSFVKYEKNAYADRLILSYATDQRGVLFRYTYTGTDGLTHWSSPVTVVPNDPNNHRWETSILSRGSRQIWILYNVNGPEAPQGIGSGQIRYAVASAPVSGPAGQTWGSEQQVTGLQCDSEYPRAWEDNSGNVLLSYSIYVNTNYITRYPNCPNGEMSCSPCQDSNSNGYAASDIHGVWYSGGLWQAPFTLYHLAGGNAMHPHLGYEALKSWPTGNYNLHLLFVDSSSGFVVRRITSADGGHTWNAPVQWSTSSWSNPFDIDPSFTEGGNGPVLSYTDPFGGAGVVHVRRYTYQ